MSGAVCPVAGCGRPREGEHVTCRRCWQDVPTELAHAVYRAWGRRVRTGISFGPDVEAHEQAKRDVVEHVERVRAERNPQLGLEL